jgi:hypothetical protein
VGDLSRYRDHVVRLKEGMPGFEGFIPFFDEEEGMEAPTYLFQDPHKSGVEKSGVVSHTKNDAFAQMIPPQLDAPRDERESPETVEEALERVAPRSHVPQALRRAYRGPGGVRCWGDKHRRRF